MNWHRGLQAARTLAVLLTLSLSIGCSSLGSALIPAHERSMARGSDYRFTADIRTNVDKSSHTKGALPGIALAEPVLGLVANEIVRGIEKESKRYSATYSTRTTGVQSFDIDSDTGHPCVSDARRLQSVVLTRVRQVAPDDDVLNFQTTIEWNAKGSAIRFIPQSFSISRVASKVASAGDISTVFLPWRWPAALGVGLSKLFGYDDAFQTDLNVQLKLDAVYPGRLHQLAVVDFPIGKVDITKHKRIDYDSDKLQHLSSPWFPLPVITNTESVVIVPLNLTATVMEANDLGDVIAKGAKAADDGKSDGIKSLLDSLGLK